MKDIVDIEKFDIKKVSNGYTVNIEYHKAPEREGGYAGREYTTLIARDIVEVSGFIESWFSRVI